MGSEKLFRKDCTRVQFPIWLRGSVHISVHVLRRVAAGISSSLCIKRHSFGQFHSLTYINRWCWLLHKSAVRVKIENTVIKIIVSFRHPTNSATNNYSAKLSDHSPLYCRQTPPILLHPEMIKTGFVTRD